MTRKYIYIFSYLIFKVTNCHYRISHSKVTNNKEAIWLYAELFLGHHDGSCHGLW